MADISDADRRFLLDMARAAIAAELRKGGPSAPPDPAPAALQQKRGCFVTLHKQGQLRGCIGTIEPAKALIDGIRENALNAAFRDPRFPPLAPGELSDVDVEISLLSVPEPVAFKDADELLEQLEPGVHGVILSKGWHRATFLPQVWKQLPDKAQFLSHLCLKAGLAADSWQRPGIDIQVYRAEHFSE